jgi:hypothetical protein
MSARKKECNQLPARKSIKFGARKSVMSALEKERIIYSRETNPQRPNARKQQNLTDLRAKKRREKNNKGRAVSSPSPGIRTCHHHLQKPERSRFHSIKLIFGQLLSLVVGIGLGSGIVLFYWGLADVDTIMKTAQSTEMTFRVLESIFVMSFFTALTIAIFEMISFGDDSGSIIGSKIGKYLSPTICITVVDCATKLAHFFTDLALATTLTCKSLKHDPTEAVAASTDPQERNAPNKGHVDGN